MRNRECSVEAEYIPFVLIECKWKRNRIGISRDIPEKRMMRKNLPFEPSKISFYAGLIIRPDVMDILSQMVIWTVRMGIGEANIGA